MSITGRLRRLVPNANGELPTAQVDKILHRIKRVENRQIETLRRLGEVEESFSTLQATVSEIHSTMSVLALFADALTIAEEKQGDIHDSR
jgi:hypothetical protein